VRARRVERVFDVLPTQGRVILWLACGHKLTLTDVDLMKLPRETLLQLQQPGAEVMCAFCPAETPAEICVAKSATRLWKEAGEP
jgi:hypothetical protein